MANLNRVMLIGRMTRDPELRYTPGGTAVADMGLAVNRKYGNKDGETKEETLFVDCTAWSKAAEALSEYTRKGSTVFIEGRLQLEEWEREGVKRSKIKVVVEGFQFLDGKPATGESKPAASTAEAADDKEIPF